MSEVTQGRLPPTPCHHTGSQDQPDSPSAGNPEARPRRDGDPDVDTEFHAAGPAGYLVVPSEAPDELRDLPDHVQVMQQIL